jgi:hypothetical protein
MSATQRDLSIGEQKATLGCSGLSGDYKFLQHRLRSLPAKHGQPPSLVTAWALVGLVEALGPLGRPCFAMSSRFVGHDGDTAGDSSRGLSDKRAKLGDKSGTPGTKKPRRERPRLFRKALIFKPIWWAVQVSNL